jgi:hypothetical protein
MYRQLRTGAITLEAAPQFEMNEQGVLCGDVDLLLRARSLSLWTLDVEKGQNVTGVITVDGNENRDIGLSIWSPSDHLVLFAPERAHEHEFELPNAIRGGYRFEFDNRHSSFTDKRIDVTVCLA